MKLNSSQSLKSHRNIIRNKVILNLVYRRFYQVLKSHLSKKDRDIIELGSGGGFVKKIIPKCTTSDVIPGIEIDKVFSAEKIPYKSNSIDAYIMLNTFHHIKNPENALQEMFRTLKKDGKIIMIEPYNSLWSRFIYQNFHHEVFDPSSKWTIPGKGRLSDANGALPWIIFQRDQNIFQKKFPDLKIKTLTPHTPLGYLAAGGLSKIQLVPSYFYPLIVKVEQILSPFNRWIAMFETIVLVKR